MPSGHSRGRDPSEPAVFSGPAMSLRGSRGAVRHPSAAEALAQHGVGILGSLAADVRQGGAPHPDGRPGRGRPAHMPVHALRMSPALSFRLLCGSSGTGECSGRSFYWLQCRQDDDPVQAEARRDRDDDPDHRVQRGDCRVQEHQLHRTSAGLVRISVQLKACSYEFMINYVIL